MLKLHYITSNNVKKIALTACIKQNYLNYKRLTEASNQDIKQNIHKQQI